MEGNQQKDQQSETWRRTKKNQQMNQQSETWRRTKKNQQENQQSETWRRTSRGTNRVKPNFLKIENLNP
ncbi:hypothetical protein VZT92_013745 [Zoarces viviparus]|uniref:Uncharacterized protein n=1 Tax=Zoarces viviparus TaxID=48416 RepID=A0AAW1F511_ZOAVI